MTDQADYPPLRPCPFCGKVPKGVTEPSIAKPFVVRCWPTCGEWYIHAATRAEAADKWNRRTKL